MSLFFQLMKAGESFAALYQLLDGSITATSASSTNCDANLIFNPDGTIDKYQDSEGGGATTAFSGSPWSNDPAEDGTGHHIRITGPDTGTDRYEGVSPTYTTWTALSSTVNFNFDWAPGGGPQGPDVSTYTIELSDDGGSTVLDSMTLTVSLSIASP